MIKRPRLRPTISRRNKYISIAPRAQQHLVRESRRGEHDLRRLVGHANFLDDLVDSFDNHSDDDDDVRVLTTSTTQSGSHAPKGHGEHFSESDSDDTASDEEWSDSSDDNEHALVRTASGIEITTRVDAMTVQQQTRIAILETEDYFSSTKHSDAGVAVPQIALVEDKVEHDVTVVEVESPMSDVAEESKDDGQLSDRGPRTADSTAMTDTAIAV